ncbi:aldo/keto reductase [Methylobacterium nodulans]|uniref:Aldo/keto reductase n=1 Tax=Methylobacterium nodulans (strain LMG 21967 / CNCM I-2342 / ORS 2060) TaxID=460265 RepID=B8ICI7_METNO|nr:aldo/keto reductase [Methylobacterium nodulans]ACL55575.1 aldo/keto reductase [Methylobacterium nodulans ORS 2060]
MTELNPSGTFAIGGDLVVHRLGFGAMRITGPGIWGEPASREAAIATLRRVPELGVDLIDTADSYGPFVSEDLIREVLHPYTGLVIATKGGLTRHGPDIWRPVGNPDYLRQCVLMSLRRLGLERIDLWQLHRIGPDCPREVQFEAIARMRDEGLIRHVGLSEVSIDDIQAAQRFFPVAAVQNRYNLVDRTSEAVLDYCESAGIGFIPWAPLDRGALARYGSAIAQAAARHSVGEGAIALAWLLKRSPVMLPIPGTGDPEHLAENMRGATVELTSEEFNALDQEGRAAWQAAR